MNPEVRNVLSSSLRKVEADIAVLKIHAQDAAALHLYGQLTHAQESIQDAIIELMPDAPQR